MPLLKSLCLVLAACVFLSGCGRNEPLVNVVDAPTDAKAGTSLEEVTKAIMLAGNDRGWQKTLVSPGLIRAKLITGGGKHVVRVDITYTKDDFSIAYSDSLNMNYQIRDAEERIHHKYNSWVQNLKGDIQRSIETLS